MLSGSLCIGAAEGASTSVLRCGSSRSARPPKIILGTFEFSLGQAAHCAQGAILRSHESPHTANLQARGGCLNLLHSVTKEGTRISAKQSGKKKRRREKRSIAHTELLILGFLPGTGTLHTASNRRAGVIVIKCQVGATSEAELKSSESI